MKFASSIHFRPRKKGFWPPVEVENPFLQEMDVPIESLLADFRWQSIDFVDALKRLHE